MNLTSPEAEVDDPFVFEHSESEEFNPKEWSKFEGRCVKSRLSELLEIPDEDGLHVGEDQNPPTVTIGPPPGLSWPPPPFKPAENSISEYPRPS